MPDKRPAPSGALVATTKNGGTFAFIRKHRWKILATALAAILLGAVTVRWWRGPLIVTSLVEQHDFVQSVVASGHVETAHRVDIGAQITATVVRVPVIEGQSVKVGDLLVALESSELRASQGQAEVAVVQAQAHLRQLREVQAPVAEQTLRQANTNLENARAVLRRNQELFKQGFISAAALQDLDKTVELADAQVRSAQKQMETTRASGSDYAVAEAAVSEARANALAARARSRYAAINAPVAGSLIARNVEVGDVVQPGKVLMTLSPMGRTQLIVNIDEKNLRLLALGQKALISADAYPQQRFAATLAYLNPGVNAQTGAVEVKLDVPSPPSILRQDMTVSVDIEVARRPNAVLVTASAVHDADSVEPWVLRVEGRHATRRVVRLGLRSGGLAEVLGGLVAGDRVLPAATAISAGARMRSATPPPIRASSDLPASSTPER